MNWATAPLRGRRARRARAIPAASRCGRRTRAASACRCTTRTAAAVLADLDLTHGAAALRRAAFEASGFVARRTIDAARAAHGVTPRRIIATGGGTRVDEWVQALADCTGLPVECTAVPEGAALGSAFLARCALGSGARRHAGRGPLGPARAHGRSRSGLGRARRRPIPTVPGALAWRSRRATPRM